MDEIALKLCDIQGRLFELSANQKYDSIKFIRVFMNSDVSRALDSKYNRMQWAGEEYLLEDVSYRITCNNGNQRTLINP